MNEYESKIEAKRQRYLELAEQHRKAGEQRYETARKMGSIIPFGQPILVGHHSEQRDRNYRKRIGQNYDKAHEHFETAKYYEQKAKTVGKGGISSDDPEAVIKLSAKLARLVETQEYMKRINKIHRAYKKNPASIDKHDLTEDERQRIINYEPEYSWIPSPFAPYQLQNNNANIRRIRERIESLKKAATREHKEITVGELTLVENTEINRVQILFPGKPSAAVRKLLKSNGFRWSPRNTAWQRHLNNAGVYATQNVARIIRDDFNGEWE